jgi:membrane protease YdiL (CAAX protease family)
MNGPKTSPTYPAPQHTRVTDDQLEKSALDAQTRGGLAGRWAQRRPLTVFFVMGFTTAYMLATLWGLAYHGQLPGGGAAAAVGIKPDELAGGLLILGLLPAALFVTWATGGREGIRTLMRRLFHWRARAGWWLTVLVALPVLTVALSLLLGDDPREIDPGSFLISQVGLLLLNFVVVNLWEEAVWTGVVQTRLEQRRGLFVSSVLTAVPFAAVHVPLVFFAEDLPTLLDIVGAFAIYLMLGLIVRLMYAVLRRATLDSLFLVALAHSVFNRTNNNDGISANLVDGEMRGVTGLLAGLALTVTVGLLYRRRMTRAFAQQLNPSERVAPRP